MASDQTTPQRSELRMEVGDKAFVDWTAEQAQRSLTELSGSFEFEYDDQLRKFLELPRAEARMDYTFVVPPAKVRILFDGELVPVGWLEDLEWSLPGDRVSARLAGRDVVGVAVDCSVNPNGPYEYNGLTVLEIVTRLCAPRSMSTRRCPNTGSRSARPCAAPSIRSESNACCWRSATASAGCC